MYFENRISNYVKHPAKKIEGYKAIQGYEYICQELQEKIKSLSSKDVVICMDFYHGTRYEEVLKNCIEQLHPDTIILSDEAKKSEEEIQKLLGNNITDDRVFGVLTTETLEHLFDSDKLEESKKKNTVLINDCIWGWCKPDSSRRYSFIF